ncbi:MAG TPA: cytochrome D1 domain-containing protein [Chitinophagaceae bacterium]
MHRFHFTRVLLITAVCCFACESRSQSTHGTLLALSKGDHTLAIVDAVSLKVLGKAPVGEDPHEVIASQDGKTAYVSIYGGGRFHEINVIDIAAHKALDNIDTRPLWGPHGLDFQAGKVWFSAEGSKAVGSYDPASGKLDWSMGTGQNRTHMLLVTADAKKIFTTNVESGTVSILESVTVAMPGPPGGNRPAGGNRQAGPGPRTDWMQTVVPVATGCEGFDISPKNGELWTASSNDGKIYIVDTASKKVTAKIDAKVFGANRVKFSVDGKMVFVTSLRDGHLFVFDAQARKFSKQIEVGHGAAGILTDPDGSRVFVACTPDNYIAIVDLKTFQVTGHLDVGAGPDGMAWVPQ